MTNDQIFKVIAQLSVGVFNIEEKRQHAYQSISSLLPDRNCPNKIGELKASLESMKWRCSQLEKRTDLLIKAIGGDQEAVKDFMAYFPEPE